MLLSCLIIGPRNRQTRWCSFQVSREKAKGIITDVWMVSSIPLQLLNLSCLQSRTESQNGLHCVAISVWQTVFQHGNCEQCTRFLNFYKKATHLNVARTLVIIALSIILQKYLIIIWIFSKTSLSWKVRCKLPYHKQILNWLCSDKPIIL